MTLKSIFSFIFILLFGLSIRTSAQDKVVEEPGNPIDRIIQLQSLNDFRQLLTNTKDSYSLRYYIMNLAEVLKRFDQKTVPQWAMEKVVDALGSDDGQLVKESITAIGQLKIPGYETKMQNIYKNAYIAYGDMGEGIRGASIVSLSSFGRDQVKYLLTTIVTEKVKYYSSGDFLTLLQALQIYGDTTCVNGLNQIKMELGNMAATLSKDDPGRYRIKNTIDMITNIENNIAKGGNK